jgi:hypothetical protein
MGQVSNALFLAALAAEAIHGRAQVQLNGQFWTDPAKRAAVIDASTEVGQTIARVFTGFISRELGEDAFAVARAPHARPDGPDPRADTARRKA